MTISIDEHLAKRVSELAQRTGLSNSGVLNLCLRQALPKLENGGLMESTAPTAPATKPLSVLMVEDSDTDAELVARGLSQAGYAPQMEVVKTAAEMASAVKSRSWDVILADWVLPNFSGLEALELHRRSGLQTPFIIVSGRIGEEAAVEAMRLGADDYVLKERWDTIGSAVDRALSQRRRTASSIPPTR